VGGLCCTLLVVDKTTGTWVTAGDAPVLHVRRCRFEVVSGPDEGRVEELGAQVIRIGRKGTDIVLNDRSVSGLHAEITLTEQGYRLRDLESSNGTFAGGLRVRDVDIPPRTTITVGHTQLRFLPLEDTVALRLWSQSEYAGMLGASWAMRRMFELIERIAPTETTVLITGETGTGKELVAEALHKSSRRGRGPFVVLDCGAIPDHLIEDQLFGHERGAFTGATAGRAGVFERAHGGTLFLDEIGELPPDAQSKLLRAVETRVVRRIGGSQSIKCDVRLVAATNRDLAVETNRGGFRSDLYYRVAVARIEVPPLRDRLEDLELLAQHFADELTSGRGGALPDDFLERARRHAWPGNVRELRNAVQQALTAPALLAIGDGQPQSLWSIDTSVPFKIAKQRFVDEFDRRFMVTLLEEHGWNISAAARATGVDRMSVYKLLERLGIERSAGGGSSGDPDDSSGPGGAG
jgi:DNA-binding NtrC family response regulator